MKWLFCIASALFMVACSSHNFANSISIDELDKINEVCIVKNPKVRINKIDIEFEKSLKARGINTKIIDRKDIDKCEYYLSYTGTRLWDVVTFINFAEVYLFKNKKEIANATYIAGNMSMKKFRSTTEVVQILVESMLNVDK